MANPSMEFMRYTREKERTRRDYEAALNKINEIVYKKPYAGKTIDGDYTIVNDVKLIENSEAVL